MRFCTPKESENPRCRKTPEVIDGGSTSSDASLTSMERLVGRSFQLEAQAKRLRPQTLLAAAQREVQRIEKTIVVRQPEWSL